MDKKKTLAQCELIDNQISLINKWIVVNQNELKYCKYNSHEHYYKGRIKAYEHLIWYFTNMKIQLRMDLQRQEKERGNKNERNS